ncbi:hypothetical protein OY671_010538, partial [Metschnikowia pulcherrima]
QGQRDHQPALGHRPHRQARRGAVQHDWPAQRDGRARGWRPCQHARVPPRLFRRRARRCRRFSGYRPASHRAGPQGGGPIPRHRRRPRQVPSGHGDQPRCIDARCRLREGSAGRHRNPSRLRRHRRYRHRPPCSHPPASARSGRKRRHRHQFRTPHQPPACAVRTAGRSARRSGDH